MKRILFATAALLIAAPAFATDFTQPITQIGGKPFTQQDGKTAADITLGSTIEQALLAEYADEKDATGKSILPAGEKFSRWKLASKIVGNKDLTLTSEELSLIKKLVEKGYPPSIVGPVWSAIDPGVK